MTAGQETPVRDGRGTTRRLISSLRPHRATLLATTALGVGSVTLNLLGPLLLGRATDLVFAGVISSGLPAGSTQEQVLQQLRAEGQDTLADVFSTVELVPGQGVDFGRVGTILLIALAAYLAASLFVLFRERLAGLVVQRTVLRLREDVTAKLHRLPLGFFDQQPRGELLSRATNDVDNVQQALQQVLTRLITSALMMVGMLVLMFTISPLLAVVVLVIVPVSAAVAKWIAARSQPQFATQWAATGTLTAHVEQMYAGHAVVREFDRRDHAGDVFDQHNEAVFRSGVRAQAISGAIEPAMVFIVTLNYVVVVVLGALRIASGSLSIGGLQAFVQYSGQFGDPLTQLGGIAAQVQSGLASVERLFELLDAEEEQADGPAPPDRPHPPAGRVEFQRVSFRYSPGSPLIDDLSLSVRPGQTVAIVGETGAGKTTLGNLLMRFYEPDGGRILVDGVDIASLPRSVHRRAIGFVLQEPWLFRGTVAENIAYGRAGATRAEVVAAAEATYVDRFVRALPDGYDTVLDGESTTVSAGERQLVTVARALLADPSILVLDEATSSVDTRTEALIQRAMSTLRAGRTSFVIAHRLSTIRHADIIVVMSAGRIVEQGTHEELLAADGAYTALYAAQFATAATPQEPSTTG